MAQYPIEGSCGHTYTYHLYGPMRDRARKEVWLAMQPCPECKKAADLAEAQQATALLPELIGSEKQVAWATKLRAAGIADVRDRWERRIASAQNGSDAQMAYLYDVADRSIAWLESQSSAKWWIDHRDGGTMTLAEIAVRGDTEEARMSDYTSWIATYEAVAQ